MTLYELDLPLVSAPGGAMVPPLTANQRLHWRKEAELKAMIRGAVTVTAKAAKIPPAEHLVVQLHYRPGDNRKRDEDNLWPTAKVAFDALAKGPRRDWVGLDIVPDDTPRYMTKLGPVIHPGPGTRRLWLTVEAR